MSTNPTPERDSDASYEVSPDADPHRCHYCGAPFSDDQLLALHRGLTHGDELSAEEHEAFEEAYEAETEAISRFRLKALGLLVVLYFGLLMAFSVFA